LTHALKNVNTETQFAAVFGVHIAHCLCLTK